MVDVRLGVVLGVPRQQVVKFGVDVFRRAVLVDDAAGPGRVVGQGLEGAGMGTSFEELALWRGGLAGNGVRLMGGVLTLDLCRQQPSVERALLSGTSSTVRLRWGQVSWCRLRHSTMIRFISGNCSAAKLSTAASIFDRAVPSSQLGP